MNSRKMAELANTTTTETAAWIPADVYARAVFMAVHAKRILGNLVAALKHDVGRGNSDTIQVRKYPARTAQTDVAEAASLTANADTVSTVSITVKKHGDYAILTDESIQFTSDDVKGRLLAEMGAALAEALEQKAYDALKNASSTKTTTLQVSGVVDYAEVLAAQAELKKAKMNPDFLIISPDHETDLLLDANLTKVAEYGAGAVSLPGEIGRIGTIRVIVHPLAVARATSTGTVQGIMLDSSRAFAEVYGKPLRFEEQRVPENDTYKEVAWVWYGCGVLDANAICLMKNA